MVKKKSFDAWMKEVDLNIEKKCGMASLDLPDQPYRSWYEDGMSAKSAAAKAVKYANE